MVKKRISKKITKIVEGYAKRISQEKKIPIKKVVIYGSQIKGTANKWSDIDVCVISSKFKDPMEAMQFLMIQRQREEIIAGLEPVGFSPRDFKEGGSLINEIKRTGIEIKIK